MSKILVTGGTGYIGSHTIVELLENGHEVVVIDNLVNSNKLSLQRVEKITGKQVKSFYKVDLCDLSLLKAVFFEEKGFDAVIHFAGLKAVGESVDMPLEYYHNNVVATLNLLSVMREFDCFDLVFSSSATIYDESTPSPISENSPLSANNPYGQSKLVVEAALKDMAFSNKNWNIVALRYFNPVGGHPSGCIGEDPYGIPNNLMPYLTQVAVGRLQVLQVFGGDYPTVDGTGVRDYIHVVDLAQAHKCAVEYLYRPDVPKGFIPCNIGAGKGYSVLEVIEAFNRVNNIKIPYRIVDRRPGDVAQSYANTGLAYELLNWEAKLDLDRMMIDQWRWQSDNPNGYIPN